MENKELLKKCCLDMNIDLSDEKADKFMRYKDLLLEWNEKINLTAITEEKEIVIKHFADCISIGSNFKFEKGASIIDVGTGAGFPGVPVKIVFDDVKMTLLDSLKKRITFLEEIVKELSLENVTCIHSRAEDGGQNPDLRESFDYCVSRAVARISVLCEYCLPFVKVGGTFISLKGPDAENEVKDGENAIKKLGGKVEDIIDVKIPFSDLDHKLVIIKKVAPTPKAYPRKAGTASKKPL